MTRVLIVISLLAAGAGSTFADEAAKARKVVDRAIKVIGGAKKLGELKAAVWKTNGTFQGRPSRAQFSGELPGKFRIDSTRLVDGKKTIYSRIINGEKGWIVDDGQVKPMGVAEIADVKSSY